MNLVRADPLIVCLSHCGSHSGTHQNLIHGEIRMSLFRVGFWQNGFFADFYFWAAGFFRGFCRRIFFPSFLWRKVHRKILQENPRQNPPKFIQQKSPTHFCRGAGPTLWLVTGRSSIMHPWKFPGAARLQNELAPNVLVTSEIFQGKGLSVNWLSVNCLLIGCLLIVFFLILC